MGRNDRYGIQKRSFEMKRVIFSLLLLPAVAFGQEAPVCHCQAQCDAMWAQATRDVENASGLRIRLATPTLLETYVTHRADLQTGTVTKTPVAGDSYAIELKLEPWVRGQSDVQDVMRTNIALFNKRVSAAGATATCH